MASVTFTIGSSCSNVTAFLASYMTLSAGFSLPQTLFASSTGVFGPGTHTMTVAVPNCFFQVDLMLTVPPTVLNGTTIAGKTTIAFTHGGSSACTSGGGGGGGGGKPPGGGGTTPPPSTAPSTPTTTTTTPVTTTTPAATSTTTTTPATTSTPTSGVAGATASGGVAGKTSAPLGAVAGATTLPFTGLPLWIAVAIGAGLLLVGIPLMRMRRRATQ